MSCYDQAGFDVRLDWGADGLLTLLGGGADVIVIVDVLSFSTAVDVATARGAVVYPYRWKDGTAAAYAERLGAHLAVPRAEVCDARPFSLRPSSLAGLVAGERIVLPSPNGAALTVLAQDSGARVLSGCLRNATAVASAAAREGRSIAVIAAGERWAETDRLRPAVEDLLGAGAIIAALVGRSLSPEASAAAAAFRAHRATLGEALIRCSSGRELRGIDHDDDMRMAAALDASCAAPALLDGAYVARAARWQPPSCA